MSLLTGSATPVQRRSSRTRPLAGHTRPGPAPCPPAERGRAPARIITDVGDVAAPTGPVDREGDAMDGAVVTVSVSPRHTMTKAPQGVIRLRVGLGVDGDAHMGTTVQHRSRVRSDPTQPNLRQVPLIPRELHDELQARGFSVTAGQMGENIPTRHVDLLGLPTGTRLQLGA